MLSELCVLQNGVSGREDADELVHVPAVQVPQRVRGRAALHAVQSHQGTGAYSASFHVQEIQCSKEGEGAELRSAICRNSWGFSEVQLREFFAHAAEKFDCHQ